MASLFETIGMDDPLGLWTPTVSTADAARAALSFSLGGDDPSMNSGQVPPSASEPVFRVNLPADGASAAQAFAVSEQKIARLHDALGSVPSRLDGLVARTKQRREKHDADGVSFGVPSDEQPEPGPEGDLLALLDQASLSSPYFPRSSAENGGTEGGVSFGLQETASAAWEEAKANFDGLMQQINREVLNFAWVETNIADSLIARTTIGWTGDAQTAFASGVSQQQVALHNRTLRIVTQTRSMRLRLFVTVVRGVTTVSTLITSPAGLAFAFPAVYQYVTKIIAQVKQLQSIQLS